MCVGLRQLHRLRRKPGYPDADPDNDPNADTNAE
jgi:hypothetical protein